MSKPTGRGIVQRGVRHLGERYVSGAFAPKAHPNWPGPWDCAELASYLVFQEAGFLFGCMDNAAEPNSRAADAYTGYWARDAGVAGSAIVSITRAANTPGAMLLREPSYGHIVVCVGNGIDTIEAHSSLRGVISHHISGRRWDYGILVPGIEYEFNEPGTDHTVKVETLRLQYPYMQGPYVGTVQRLLNNLNYHLKVDGVYGPATHNAVVDFQKSKGTLVVDGEVGPLTMDALKDAAL